MIGNHFEVNEELLVETLEEELEDARADCRFQVERAIDETEMPGAACMKPIQPGKQGPFFEIRTYHFAGGELPIIKKNWESAIEVRLQFGPVVAVWSCELGKVNTFQHIWPYNTLDQREEIRKKAQATGLWPAGKKAVKEGGRDYNLVAQENKIVMPSSFSPLQ